MILIGDVHGKFNEYFDIISKCDESIQLGDFGFGFRESPEINGEHYFIRGNHDSPEECKKHNKYLGDYGIFKNMFFISGGFSIDYKYRQWYESVYHKKIWWEDEQISENEYYGIKKIYIENKPDIVIAHDCPEFVTKQIIGGNARDKIGWENNYTNKKLLPSLFKLHKPKIWVFGHYHVPFKKKINGTLFICLSELETINLNDLEL